VKNFCINTKRLIITELDESMIESLQANSLDENNRRFVPDEVFETLEEACEATLWLMSCYDLESAPLVYPILLKSGENIGHVQIVPLGGDWEIGYHIAKNHTGNGYATEALKAFLPTIMERLNIKRVLGIVDTENVASCAVLEKCEFVLKHSESREYHGEIRDVYIYLYCSK